MRGYYRIDQRKIVIFRHSGVEDVCAYICQIVWHVTLKFKQYIDGPTQISHPMRKYCEQHHGRPIPAVGMARYENLHRYVLRWWRQE
jgi:hypothetical protein